MTVVILMIAGIALTIGLVGRASRAKPEPKRVPVRVKGRSPR